MDNDGSYMKSLTAALALSIFTEGGICECDSNS